MVDSAAKKLDSLRKRSGLTLEQFAIAAGYKGASSIQRYLSAGEYPRPTYSHSLVTKFAAVLVGLGDPEITKEEVYSLSDAKDVIQKSSDEDRNSMRPDSEAGGMILVGEVDVRSSAGGGSIIDFEEESGQWGFPAGFVWSELRASPDDLRIITNVGDSMVSRPPQPDDIHPGDKMVVHVGDRSPSPPGIFIVFDGVGLVTKRIEHIPGSDPSRIRIVSNNPSYSEYERTSEEAHIVGRVIGKWMRY